MDSGLFLWVADGGKALESNLAEQSIWLHQLDSLFLQVCSRPLPLALPQVLPIALLSGESCGEFAHAVVDGFSRMPGHLGVIFGTIRTSVTF